MSKLDLSPLKAAISSLDRIFEAAQAAKTNPAMTDNDREAMRAGVIQGFEYTYELSWNFIQRWLVANRSKGSDLELKNRNDLFRLAAREGLIRDPLAWFEYGKARNLTSHTYNEIKADKVVKAAAEFLPDAQYLLKKLQKSNDRSEA